MRLTRAICPRPSGLESSTHMNAHVRQPTVTVVIPAFNAERTIAHTLRSVLGQTFGDLEILVVDDGSLDGTVQAAASIADGRIRVLTQTNGGAASARNAGITAARGEFVAFLDADDLWLPHKLERQVSLLRANPPADAVQTSAYFVDDELHLLSVETCVDAGDDLARCLQFLNLPAFCSAVMVRRATLFEIGMFDRGLVILEDWDLALRLARRNGLRSLAEPLVLYRVHPGNRSRNVEIHVAPGEIVLRRLFADPALPPNVRRLRRRAYGAFYRMLAGGYLRAGRPGSSLLWAMRAVAKDPRQIAYILAMPLRRLRRAWYRRTHPVPISIESY
jgi:glycosyltransferase involved in cell wall biosynthesis